MSLQTPGAADTEMLALARRSGWPPDLCVLLARYPRERWSGHANLGAMARFWLSRHAMFRELAAMLEAIAGDFRNGTLPAPEFPARLVPRLQFLLRITAEWPAASSRARALGSPPGAQRYGGPNAKNGNSNPLSR